MRELLEDIKRMMNEIYVKEPKQWSGMPKIALYAPASPADIKKFFSSKLGRLVPRSYGDFLAASDGLENGWNRLSFLGTTPRRQKRVKEVIDYMHDDQTQRFRSFEGAPTDARVRAWEKKTRRLFLPKHAIVGATSEDDVLVYDANTRQKDGEMELCWWPSTHPIKKRYRDIVSYFTAIRSEVRRYHQGLTTGGKARQARASK